MDGSLLPGWLRYRHGRRWLPAKAAYGLLAWIVYGLAASAIVALVVAAVWLLIVVLRNLPV